MDFIFSRHHLHLYMEAKKAGQVQSQLLYLDFLVQEVQDHSEAEGIEVTTAEARAYIREAIAEAGL